MRVWMYSISTAEQICKIAPVKKKKSWKLFEVLERKSSGVDESFWVLVYRRHFPLSRAQGQTIFYMTQTYQ